MASTSAVLGAATGAGLALLVAMTLVIYRYYAHKRKAKEWSALERCSSSGSRQSRGQGSNYNYTVSQQQQFSLPKESHAVQPGSSAAVLAHQSRSFPGGQPRLARSPSVSSQGSVDSGSVARQASIRKLIPKMIDLQYPARYAK
ncbi:Hypothetical predicted protein [Cloeon dipterum]|uniref:Uncharacterized protein n=1 Tax=Cloeon dipterum TaxID=197152 RepID=A0A8S1CP36_9INSE|nr:Hypothetical predicted protein [Cloeon dipterum]